MKPSFHKQVRAVLKSADATAEAFSSVGWDEEHSREAREFWCLVNYGILQEMELDVVLERAGAWYVQMYVPPVRPWLTDLATHVCDEIATCGVLVATVYEDGECLIGATGDAPIRQVLPTLWRAYGRDDVYECVLTLCGLSEATDEDETQDEIPDTEGQDPLQYNEDED